MKLALILSLLSILSFAKERPTLVLHPIEFKLAPVDTTQAQIEDLQSELRRLSRKNQMQLIDTPEFNCTDCLENDKSLTALAQKAKSLYVLYANLNLSLEGQVTALVRVVRDDGVLVKPATEVTMPLGKEKFVDVATLALDMAFTKLDLPSLPSEKPVVKVEPVKVEPVKVEPVQVSATQSSPLKPLGFALAGVGAAGAIAGLIVNRAGDKSLSLPVPFGEGQAAADRHEQESIGVGIALGGLGIAAIGVILILAAPNENQPVVSIFPIENGAVASVGGRF